MISICIPIYNFDVRPLVGELTKQIQFIFDYEIEIILIDDASDEQFRIINQSLQQLHEYIQLEENIGRAKIRNTFLRYASQPYFLFLDCDSSLENNPNFIKNYIQTIINHQPKICYGGRIYPAIHPSTNQKLSWKYGSVIESKKASTRNKNSYQNFQTNNFLIHRSLLQTIQFDESLLQYGHEDTMFGIELSRSKQLIFHLENPVLNNHIETNEVFLEKTKQAINNLVFLVNQNKITAKEFKQIRLLKYAELSHKLGISSIFYMIFTRLEVKIIKQLNSKRPNLKLFNLYKLYLYIKTKKELS